MKSAGYDNVPPVTLEDHQHHGKITNGFDSIIRSVFGVCESRIDLRVTTLFAFSGKELDDEKEIHYRTAFMLILLFVSEWIADQKDECPHVSLKEPKSRLVHACFNKLFKDIYHGNNEGFKAYIFDEESSVPSFGSPNGSIISSVGSPNGSIISSSIDHSSVNISPASEQMIYDETKDESLIGPLSQTTDALLKAVTLKSISEEKLLAKSENLEAELNAKTTELEKVYKLVADLMKEKENAEESSLKAINDMEDLVRQNAKIYKEKESLLEANTQLQVNRDECMDRLTSAEIEKERLCEDNEDLMKVVSSYAKNEIRLEEEKQALQEDLNEKIMELENYGNFIEEKKVLEFDLSKTKLEMTASNNLVIQKEEEIQKLLNEMNSLNVANGKFKKNLDAINEELSAVKLETDNLKESIEAFMEEKEALQRNLDNKMFEMENVTKHFADSMEENQQLKQDFAQKEDGYQRDLGKLRKNMENLEEEKQALQNAFDRKTLELETVKELLSKVQKELQEVVKQVRGLYLIKSEIEAELNEFKVYFDGSNASVVEKIAEMKTLSNGFINDNISNVNTPAFSDEENISENISDTFDEHLDSGIGSSEQTPEINTTTVESIFIKKQSSSSLSRFFMFFISLFIFFAIHLYLWGAIIPAWVRLELHHDHLPPQ
uniref:Uncharacterized protein n=1 Tax=Panagrolaimus davidi TaxID=227884 RepID=A0A914P6V6_9BILA